jgi:deoxyadenosine/deoxycytidine kinase
LHKFADCNRIADMHIAIAGNIGAGKTTLTGMLAKHYGWEPRYEPVRFNPYLEDYYADIKRWSFCLEVYFLKQRFRDVLDIAKANHPIIQDRSIYEGVYVFVSNNYEMGNLSERDYQTYMELFDLMTSLTKTPDLMIYLRKSVPALVAQIQKRGREYEQTMPLDYLTGLNNRYEDFIFNRYKGDVLVIDSDEMDFEHNPKDFESIVNRIDAALFGLFPIK